MVPVGVFDARVLGVLGRFVSPINARVIAERSMRVLEGRRIVSSHDRVRYLTALRTTARLFVKRDGLHELDAALDCLAGDDDVAEQTIDQKRIRINAEEDLRDARLMARDTCKRLGSSNLTIQRVATTVSELARNILSYTPGGYIDLCPAYGPPPKMVIIAEDRGTGIKNLEEILGGRYRSRTGLGRGLLGVKQLMEAFEITTGPTGTRIRVEAILR